MNKILDSCQDSSDECSTFTPASLNDTVQSNLKRLGILKHTHTHTHDINTLTRSYEFCERSKRLHLRSYGFQRHCMKGQHQGTALCMCLRVHACVCMFKRNMIPFQWVSQSSVQSDFSDTVSIQQCWKTFGICKKARKVFLIYAVAP